jgi:hypothetical protein
VVVFLAAAAAAAVAAAATDATVIKGKKAGQGLNCDQFLTNFQAMSSVKNYILIFRPSSSSSSFSTPRRKPLKVIFFV